MRGLLLIAAATLAAGCASYSENTEQARRAYYAGEYEQSVESWTELLAGGGRDKDRPLLLLERGIANLALGRLDAAARDFQDGDEILEVMDFSGDPAQVGSYLFSEDSGLYRGPPHEKILVPTLLSLTFGAMGDSQRARTAANAAYSQMDRFGAVGPGDAFSSPLAYILLGLTAEEHGDTQRAHTALAAAYEIQPVRALEPVLLRLLEANARRFGGHWIRGLEEGRRRWGEAEPRPADAGELLVVVLNGRAPVRVSQERRLDAYQQRFLIQNSTVVLLQDHPDADVGQAQVLFERQSTLPMAVVAPRESRFEGGEVGFSDGAVLPLEEVLPLDRQCFAWFEESKDRLTTAALTRLSFRLAVRVGTYLAVKNNSDDSFLAALAAVTAGAILQAADTPDTRCWSLLPRNVLLQRRVLPAGEHPVELRMAEARGWVTFPRTVEIAPGRTTLALFVVPD